MELTLTVNAIVTQVTQVNSVRKVSMIVLASVNINLHLLFHIYKQFSVYIVEIIISIR